MEVLLQARADPTLGDKQGCTPVHFAASCGHANMLETLLQYGGSSSTPDKRGFTPIHKAAYNGHDKCLEVLLEVGVASPGELACRRGIGGLDLMGCAGDGCECTDLGEGLGCVPSIMFLLLMFLFLLLLLLLQRDGDHSAGSSFSPLHCAV